MNQNPRFSRRAFLNLFFLVLTHLTAHSFTLVMAVDRSKFRTCEQTSFCRRHRFGRSASIYKYRILPESIRFHNHSDPNINSDGDNYSNSGDKEDASSNNKEESKKQPLNQHGILTSFVKRMLKSNDSNEELSQKVDPYMNGPSNVFSATLVNTSPTTSTHSSEALSLTVHLHKDGVARVRITEVYGLEGTVYQKARWTADDLVLNLEEMKIDSAAEILYSGSKNLKKEMVERILHAVNGSDNRVQNEDLENYVVFRYGEDDVQKQSARSLLAVQLNPFAFHLWRGQEVDGSPLISFNSDSLMHFEIRREKDPGHQHENGNSDVIMKEKNGDFDDDGDDNELLEHERGDIGGDDDYYNELLEDAVDSMDRHGGKEIVGYWEDGLAIYADGTREQPSSSSNSNLDSKDLEGDKDEVLSEQRRILTEENISKLDTDGMWEETFQSHVDSKPHGPMSIGADIHFPNSSHLFGLPEHASETQLKTTAGDGSHYTQPYRLYNLDVFEYELDETMALYGEVPLIVSHSIKGGTVGVFWFNPTETFVDVEKDSVQTGTKTHWMSESGIIDLFLLPGPNPHALYGQYARLTGRMPLPPMFSLGYHQCRWNYRDEQDVYNVHSKFEELDYPYDVLWLDIEHTDGKRYFTWDSHLFPNPEIMQEKLNSQGRRMVTIVDPHIKRDNHYYIHKEATSKGLYVKDKTGTADFDGWCWPGSSSYLDFTSEKVRLWWAEQFGYNRYKGSTPSLFTWNDMNEPSVFNGPEVSMSKDLRNLEGVEHREWHNLYGMLFHRATSEGLIKRNKGENERPFVLSRSFFAGSQKYGAIWTGDNESSWSHLKIAAPMLLGLNVAALSFVGADVGGFFGNPDGELMTRWMQAGAYQPFFRGHAHHDSKRREPWIFGDEWMIKMRRAAMARYALLPYWYTVFREAGETGMPVMRTMWMQYPMIEELFSVDDQYLIGSDLLVKPVTSAGATQTQIAFPSLDLWYDVDTMEKLPTQIDDNKTELKYLTLKSGIDKIPVYQRGGSIIARKLRLRRSTQTMTYDPYTLYVALDDSKMASGELYMDDEHSFDYEINEAYCFAKFSVDLNSSLIRNEVSIGSNWDNDEEKSQRIVERIIIMGLDQRPDKLTHDSISLDFDYNESSKILIVRKPDVSALSNWEIEVKV